MLLIVKHCALYCVSNYQDVQQLRGQLGFLSLSHRVVHITFPSRASCYLSVEWENVNRSTLHMHSEKHASSSICQHAGPPPLPLRADSTALWADVESCRGGKLEYLALLARRSRNLSRGCLCCQCEIQARSCTIKCRARILRSVSIVVTWHLFHVRHSDLNSELDMNLSAESRLRM